MHPFMMELFGRFGGGNFNIHNWAGFGYSIYSGRIGFYLFGKELTKLFGPRQQKILTVYTLTSGVLTIKEHIKKAYVFCRLLKHFEAS